MRWLGTGLEKVVFNFLPVEGLATEEGFVSRVGEKRLDDGFKEDGVLRAFDEN